jgi:hypothetical protein
MRFGFDSFERKRPEGFAGRVHTDPLEFIMEGKSETFGCPGKGRVSKSVRAAWIKWGTRVMQELEIWARKPEHAALFAPKGSIRDLEDPPYNVYSTLAESGAGIWDGRWDPAFHVPQVAIRNLRDHLERHLAPDFRALEEVLDDAACSGTLNG